MGGAAAAPGLNLVGCDGHGLQEVLGRQSLTDAGDLKTAPGDANHKSQRLARGFEPDLGNPLPPERQGGPLVRGRLVRKGHAAPPSESPPRPVNRWRIVTDE